MVGINTVLVRILQVRSYSLIMLTMVKYATKPKHIPIVDLSGHTNSACIKDWLTGRIGKLPIGEDNSSDMFRGDLSRINRNYLKLDPSL